MVERTLPDAFAGSGATLAFDLLADGDDFWRFVERLGDFVGLAHLEFERQETGFQAHQQADEILDPFIAVK